MYALNSTSNKYKIHLIQSGKPLFKELEENLSQCCGKIPNQDDVQHIRDSIDKIHEESVDLSISDSPDPLNDPIESTKNDHDWWTTKGNHIVVFTDSDGQINYDIVAGPDRGVHRFYDPQHMREGQTGVENPRNGTRRHDKG